MSCFVAVDDRRYIQLLASSRNYTSQQTHSSSSPAGCISSDQSAGGAICPEIRPSSGSFATPVTAAASSLHVLRDLPSPRDYWNCPVKKGLNSRKRRRRRDWARLGNGRLQGSGKIGPGAGVEPYKTIREQRGRRERYIYIYI